MLALDDNQQKVVDRLCSGRTKGAGLIAAGVGEGKTRPAVATALRMGAKVTLLVLPLGTRVGWERTFRLAGYKGEFYRLEKGQHFDKLLAREPGVYLIGWQYFARVSEKIVKWASVKPDVAIADEAHRGQNRKAKTTQRWNYVKPVKLKLALSGTPFGNKFEGAWAVTRSLWPDLVDRSFWRWVDEWATLSLTCGTCFAEAVEGERVCHRCYKPINERNVTRGVAGEKKPGAYFKSLPGYFWWESKSDGEIWREEPLRHPLLVELSPKHRKIYTQMEDSQIAWLDGNPLVADLPITSSTRLRQIALGVPSVEETGNTNDDGTPEVRVWFEDDAESPKIDALNEFLDGYPDENVFVLVASKVFANILPGRIKADTELWTGDTPQKERERILRDWGTGDKRSVLVATIDSIGEGVDGLQHVCNTVVWLSKSNNGIMNQQAAARLARRGQTKRVVSVEIIAVETEDEPDNNRLANALRERMASIKGGHLND